MTAAVTRIAEAARYQQAKSMLMLIYGMEEAAAFDLLKWRPRRPTSVEAPCRTVAADFRPYR